MVILRAGCPQGTKKALSKDCVVVNRTNVMVVDGLAETEEVLKAVLEPRGMQVTRVRSTHPCNSSGPPETPSVLVLHESEWLQGSSSQRLRSPAPWNNVPRVVIGQHHTETFSTDQGCRYLSQPFQYAELVTAIESLLRSH